jgi:hypothetical protein
MVTIDPKDLIGQIFLKESEPDGQKASDRIIQTIVDKQHDLKQNSEYIELICELRNSNVDEILTYNEILDHIEK